MTPFTEAQKRKPKPKFKVGQVVAIPGMDAFVKIKKFAPRIYLGETWRTYEVIGLDETCPTMDEKQMRPLTAREKGKP